MRILLIAYDYPPLASPQAIRWHYLTRELARLGVDVHVLAPQLPISGISMQVPEGVIVHRCGAGGLAGWLVRRQRARPPDAAPPSADVQGTFGAAPARGANLNWKGRLHQRLDRLIGLWCYPDSRGQWLAPACAALPDLLAEIQPDVVISSHEPAVSLEIGLQAAGKVSTWLADLGDPVLAPYTPRHWRRRAGRLEARVCATAAAISVTTSGTRDQLIARHGMAPDKVFVLSQGYDDRQRRNPWTPRLQSLETGGDAHLLYTGRFYPFRDPMALLEAVLAQPRVRLTVAAPEVKPECLAIAARSAGRIVFLGEQSHDRVLALQAECDVLVNIGNALEAQTPGKLYEYLGSGKPILHCHAVDDDPANVLIRAWGRGWVCRNDRASLQAFLGTLVDSPQQRCAELSRDDSGIAQYGWSVLAEQLLRECRQSMCRGMR
ncbi:glycosyltransferase [Rhodanobacter sp. Si-c]|uniref:Glycosyltransferase n=1 Tax=Rhodanobacter lycopersici TaxID=3162487 RepID=A0ABV3QCS4_9GAMM